MIGMYGYVIVASWLILMAVWVLGAFTAKRDASGGSAIVRWLWQLAVLGLLIFALTWNLPGDATVLGQKFFDFGPAAGWAGAVLTVAGVAVAIWARLLLGRDWGTRPKEEHVLVTGGPYAVVRHPLYSGAILALFGSALTGSMVAVVLLAVSILFCLRRIDQEERDMLSLFPDQYPAYQSHTKRFIPLVW